MLACAMTMTLRFGFLDGLIAELQETPSSSRRATLLRKLALSHTPEVIETMAPFLASEGRVLRACVEGIASFGEDARRPMLAILGDEWRRELHPGAVMVLARIVRKARRDQRAPSAATF